MNPEMRAVVAVLIMVAITGTVLLGVLINEIGIGLTVKRKPRPMLFDWENNTDTLLDLEPLDGLTDEQIEAMFNALRVADLVQAERRRAPLYAVPDLEPNVFPLPTKSDARLSPDAA